MNKKNRRRLGNITGVVSLLSNIVLAVFKFIVGYMSNSIAVISDGFNNLTDSFSAVTTIIGFKVASKPADDKHPYGHGRMEYICGFIVAMLIIFTSLTLVKDSILRFVKPSKLDVSMVVLVVLLVSILIKLGLFFFIKVVNKKVNSPILDATKKDSLSDTLVTLVTILSLVFSKYTTIPLDAVGGMIVSIVIFIAGVKLLTDNVNSLLGEEIESSLKTDLESEILNSKYVYKIIEFKFHDYGPMSKYITVQVEAMKDYSVKVVKKELIKLMRRLNNKYLVHVNIYVDSHGTSIYKD